MVRTFRTVTPADPLSRVVEATLDGFQQDFPVVEGGRVVGVLDRAEVVAALREHGDRVTVAEVIQPKYPTAHPNEPVEAVMGRLATAERHCLPVIRDGELVGLLTADNLGDFLTFREALRGWRSDHPNGRPWSPWSRDGRPGHENGRPTEVPVNSKGGLS